MTSPDPSFLSDFFSNFKIKYERCLEPTAKCQQPSIRAHSIQNAQVIDRIQSENHVLMMSLRPDIKGINVGLRSVGRNQASTFTGLCSHHDAEIFRPIDTNVFNAKDGEHLFLISYRAVLREHHAIMEGAMRLQAMLHGAIEKGEVSKDEPSGLMLVATEALMRGYKFYQYKARYFDVPYMRGDFSGIVHDVIVLNNQTPTIAASTFNSLEQIIAPDGFTGIISNVMPVSDNQTLVIYSYCADHSAKARNSAAIQTIIHSEGNFQKYEISRHLLAVTENFMLAPSFVSSWSHEKRAAVIAAFQSTIGNHVDIGQDPNFMLF